MEVSLQTVPANWIPYAAANPLAARSYCRLVLAPLVEQRIFITSLVLARAIFSPHTPPRGKGNKIRENGRFFCPFLAFAAVYI